MPLMFYWKIKILFETTRLIKPTVSNWMGPHVKSIAGLPNAKWVAIAAGGIETM